MQYWHSLITQKSFDILKELNKKYKFILIGGWAVFLYTHSLKSKDIDIVIDHEEFSRLKEEYQVFKNERLKKYEIKIEGIDIDIYLPYYSNPGLPAEEIKKFAVKKEGFSVPWPEVLLILKQTVFEQRKNTPKGNKDKLDIFSLILLEEFDFKRYKNLLKKYNLFYLLKYLKSLLKETYELKELNLSRHRTAKIKREILEKLDS